MAFVTRRTGTRLSGYVSASGERNAAMAEVVDAADAGRAVDADTVRAAMYALEGLKESGAIDRADFAEVGALLDEMQESTEGE